MTNENLTGTNYKSNQLINPIKIKGKQMAFVQYIEKSLWRDECVSIDEFSRCGVICYKVERFDFR